MLVWLAVVLVVCVSAVVAAVALALWFRAQRYYRRLMSNNRSLYFTSPGEVGAPAIARRLYEETLPVRAKVLEVLRHGDFQDDLDEEPLSVSERREVVARRAQYITASKIVTVDMLQSDPAAFFEAIELLATVCTARPVCPTTVPLPPARAWGCGPCSPRRRTRLWRWRCPPTSPCSGAPSCASVLPPSSAS